MTAASNYAPPYGIGKYGLPRVYGVPLYTPYTVEPIGSAENFTAQSKDYTTILVKWSRPQVPNGITISQYQLVQNRYGFPVDQNDGNILLSSSNYFGNQYQDQNVIPGSFHYYGFYILLSTGAWVRAGFTSCLAVTNHGSGQELYGYLPNYFRSTDNIDLTAPAGGNAVLLDYLNVIGWGLDYVKTQYDTQFNTLNNPMQMSLRDLYNLAEQLGIPFQPEVPASVMRKAVANWTVVSQQRGTQTGIGNAITLLTGYDVDLQTGVNKLLENDQSQPLAPIYSAWNVDTAYKTGNMVTYNGYTYVANVNSLALSPTGSNSNNTQWNVKQDVADPAATLANTANVGVPTGSGGNNTGTMNTWEAIYSGQAVNYVPPAGGTLTAGVGEPVVGATSTWTGHTIRVVNEAATAQTIWLRSVSRAPSDLNSANWVPDAQQVVQNGIPIPQFTPRSAWNSTTRYKTHALVTYNNMLFQAQRASTNAPPPIAGQALNTNPFFNGSTSGWTFTGFGSPTLSTSVTSASGISFVGTSCVQLPVTSSTVNPTATSSTVNVIPGATYTVSVWIQTSATFANLAQLSVTWNGPGGLTSTTSGTATSVSSPVNTFNLVTYTVTAPSFATSAAATLTLNASFAGSFTFSLANFKFACWATPEWIPMSKDGRLRYMFSGYFSQSLLVGANETTPVTPFAEFYDQSGKMIGSRVFCRTATPGTPAPPTNLSYDSFTLQPGAPITGRTLDSDDTQWSSVEGQFTVGGFAGGSAYPTVAGTPSIALITGTANGFVAATFSTMATAPQETAIIFRYSSAGNYYHAGPTQLWIVQSGAFTLVGTYSTAFSAGDRMTVELNGSAITIFRNGVSVLTATNSTFSTATQHGIGVEAT